jgi:acyl-CoA thioesterase
MTTILEQIQQLLARMDEREQQLALTLIKRIGKHQAHGAGFTWSLGVVYEDVQPGFSRCSLQIDPGHYNPAGIAHGGVAYSLLDTAMGGAFWTALERPLGCATLELKINYLRPIVAGTIIATAELVERTTRFGILTGRVVNEAGELLALGQGTFAIINYPKE